MSIFLYETPSCMHRLVDNPSQQIDICSACGSRNTLNIVDVRPSPTQKSMAKRSYNKDPETIFGDEADRSPQHKIVPSTSYAVSSDDSDFEHINTIMNDRLRCKRNDDENEASTASTSEVETSDDDSKAKPSIKVKHKDKRASDRSTSSELHINCVENRRPFQRNVIIIEWIKLMKIKAQKMERPRTRNFANWEKWQMLIFLIENDWIDRAKGYDVWQHMIRRKDWNHRTKMSLNNHFLKSILPSIETFQLPKEIEIRFLRLRNKK